jgi:hypothetical protein
LVLLPTLLLLSVLVGYLSSIRFQTAIGGGSLLATIALVDALFLNPPINPGGS